MKIHQDQKEALCKNEQRFMGLFEQAVVGVALIKTDTGEFKKINPRFCDLVGYSMDEMSQKTFQEITHTDDLQANLGNIYKLVAGEISKFTIEKRYHHKNGSLVWVNLTVSITWNPGEKPSHYIAIVEDITLRKQAEKERDEALKIAEQAKHEAERANSTKSEFLGRMSHELRTPLNAIHGFSQLLRLDEQWMNEEQSEWVEHIFEAGGHLLYLVNEVLDLTKIDAKKMKLSIEDVSLDFIFSSALVLVKNLALKKGVTIYELPMEMPRVHADAKRLKQVMVNLLSNAIKYNCKGGAVIITLTSALEGWVRINIADCGIGIKPEDQDAVFDPFYRVKLKGETIEGTGIGLSVVKKLVEAMNGRIGVNSEYGQGSTFWIELPQAQPIAVQLVDEDAAALSATVLNAGQNA